jgi:hypothetical protein
VMPLVTSSERGRGQTEFLLVIGVKMWCDCSWLRVLVGEVELVLECTLAVEGDSPVNVN